MFYEVLVSRVFRKTPGITDGVLTYTSPEKLLPGTVVTVPLGRVVVPAIVYRKVPDPKASFKIRPISSVLYSTPLPPHLLHSVLWLSRYYLTPLPQVTNLIIPTGVTKKRRTPKPKSALSTPASSAKTAGALSTPATPADTLSTPVTSAGDLSVTSEITNGSSVAATPLVSPSDVTTLAGNPALENLNIPLNPAQVKCLSELRKNPSHTKLLHGVTGSGKTNIYLTLAAEAVQRDQSVILLVPEIALTSQLVQVFGATFGDRVTLIHSKQTEAERHKIWENLLTSPAPSIVIGPRSALFAPVKNLGLIIIDEAHESTYFQEQPPKYNALRLASFIASDANISCIYGTATPLVSDYYLAEKNGAYIPLTQKAKSTAVAPDIQVVDFKDRASFSKNRYFSNQLLSAISKNLENHHQTLIFHNRRGSAPLTICENCGWQALCPTCYLPLTLHTDSYKLVCHVCGHEEKVPTSCPECKHLDIIHKGFGTKLLESELKKLFKDANIARFDTDNTRDSSLEMLYDSVKSGEIDIIVGTQTIARGFDFPSLATVGVVQADAGLSLPDYASEERTFHLLTQVIGRVGRGHLKEASAIIQTYQPGHPVISCAIKNDYATFTDYILKQRQKAHFPPFYYVARLSVVYKTESVALSKIKQVYDNLNRMNLRLIISQPTPAFHERTASGYSWQIVIKSPNRIRILRAISELDNFANIHFTIDPPSLL